MAKETSRPVAPVGSGIVWQNGKGFGGIYSLRRVTPHDKIRQADINQLRGFIEHLWDHTHAYEDQKGC